MTRDRWHRVVIDVSSPVWRPVAAPDLAGVSHIPCRRQVARMCAALVPVPPTLVAPSVASGLPLEAARAAFAWLCRGPHPVAVDGRRIPGLPRRPVPIDELADRLDDPHTPAGVRDAVWAHLVRRSRAEGATWTVVCAGLAAPGLEQISHRLYRSPRCSPARQAGRRPTRLRPGAGRVEVEAAVLAGFLAELAVVDL